MENKEKSDEYKGIKKRNNDNQSGNEFSDKLDDYWEPKDENDDDIEIFNDNWEPFDDVESKEMFEDNWEPHIDEKSLVSNEIFSDSIDTNGNKYSTEKIDKTDNEAIKKTIRQKLFSDGKSKECSKCHQIKPNIDFSTTKGSSLCLRRLRSICRECHADEMARLSYLNKFNIATKIYSGKFNGKCVECDSGLDYLPTLEFHHPNPNLKTTTWSKSWSKDWKSTLKILEKEKVVLLCRNCHTKEQATIFISSKEVILRKDLFRFPGLVIDKFIFSYVKNNYPNYDRKVKSEILGLIKKRSVIEQLYDGKCIGCGKITVNDNLVALEFHHLSSNLAEKKLKWKKLKHFNIKEIINLLVKEKCVCLCANCHKMEHSKKYKKLANEILGNKTKKIIEEYYHRLKTNISSYKFKNLIPIDPLDKIYGFGETIKKYILHIFILSLKSASGRVSPSNLEKSLGITRRNINKNIFNLKKKNLIETRDSGKNKQIILTEKSELLLEGILVKLAKYKKLETLIPKTPEYDEIHKLIEFSNSLENPQE